MLFVYILRRIVSYDGKNNNKNLKYILYLKTHTEVSYIKHFTFYVTLKRLKSWTWLYFKL